MAETSNSYDRAAYPGRPYPQSHPERLATVATLYGMAPKPIVKCRVLEFGCGQGSNLLPMAEQLPDSQFVGIDLSKIQIDHGQFIAESLQLTNIDLRCQDLCTFEPNQGPFDYIIAHGLLSWIAADARERLLDLCAALLAPQGIVYISYNTYPGWHMRGSIRKLMRMRAGLSDDPFTNLQAGKELLAFFSAQLPDTHAPYAKQMSDVIREMQSVPDGQLIHDELETVNQPFYFWDLYQLADSKNLCYLGESDLQAMLQNALSPALFEKWKAFSGNRAQREQYWDVLVNRSVRQSLFCAKAASPGGEIRSAQIHNLYIGSNLKVKSSETEPDPEQAQIFIDARGKHLVCTQPIAKAALAHLAQRWPGRQHFRVLLSHARRLISSTNSSDDDSQDLARFLTSAYQHGFVECFTQPAPFVTEISAKPKASALARLMATEPGNFDIATRRHHETALDRFHRHLLSLLDGEHTHSEIVDLMTVAAVSGELDLKFADHINEDKIQTIVANQLGACLKRLASAALLIA